MSDFILFGLAPAVRSTLLLFGGSLFVAGIFLIFRHLQHWQIIESAEQDQRVRLFELRKFRRRGTVACCLSVAGAAMMGLYWAADVRVFAILALVLFFVVLAILGLAILDLMSVGLHEFGRDDDSARKKLVQEYHRMREKKRAMDEAEKSSDSTS